MASQFVSGTYRSYKAGTAKILEWLFENATKCGYGVQTEEDDDGMGASLEIEKTSTPKSKSKPKPKPKGKKGKGSKAKGSGKAKAKKILIIAENAGPSSVPLKDFILLAETSE